MDEARSKVNAERVGRFQVLWPDVKTEKGINDAIKGGSAAAGYIAFSNLIGIGFLLAGRGSAIGMDGDTEVVLGFTVINALLAVVAAALAWLIWKKRNLMAASVGLAWVGFEFAAKIASMSGGRGIIVAIFALIFAVNGVRGAFAARQHAARPAPTA